MQVFIWEVSLAEAGKRLDLYVQEKKKEWSRSRIQKMIREGKILLNNQEVKTGQSIKEGDIVKANISEPKPTDAKAEKIPLDIVYEDSDMVVVNKPRGMVVHPAVGHQSGTLVNALLAHCQDLSGINDTIRPGIVHRLDKDTTGLLVVAKNESAQKELSSQLKKRSIERTYRALVSGCIKENSGMIDAPIGRHPVHRKKMAVGDKGRSAVTYFSVIKRFDKYTYVEIRLETGRTHQIRVHFSYIGHPVVGDKTYGSKKSFSLEGQALHAYRLALTHPTCGGRMEWEADLPEDMKKVLEHLKENSASNT